MNLIHLFINPQTKKLRSGWRALFFCSVVTSPLLIVPGSLLTSETEPEATIDLSLGTAAVYLLLIGWLAIVSWLFLRFFEALRLAALGLHLYHGWWRDVLKGMLLSGAMIGATVAIQAIGGGTQLKVNPVFMAKPVTVMIEVLSALLLLILAGAFEELAYRGYAFQTLLRGAPAIVPITLFSFLFGLGHWYNPSRTSFSTINTVLAGVWLSMAYLKTRSLWFPIALHFGWNWMMGPCFGLPISGLLIPKHPLLVSTSGEPVWLTGGSYGCEGGIAATIVFVLATIIIWRAKWLTLSPEMEAALAEEKEKKEEIIRLGL